MTIIIDGPDGAGKTTLVKALKEYYNCDSVRLTYNDPKDFNFYDRLLEKTECIFDRHFLSEVVYASIFGRPCQLEWHDICNLYEKVKALNIKLFILDTTNEEILRRLEVRGGEHQEIIDNMKTIQARFRRLAKRLEIDIIDTSKVSFEDIIAKIGDRDEENKRSIIK